tara:strand:+ start:378 stop:1628 length:1251 start_codon:yes stop_codon:yes gene_type:complete
MFLLYTPVYKKYMTLMKEYHTYINKKVKSCAFLTSNGTEPLWKHYKTYYDTTGRQGSNCYSFAMNDFRPHGARSNKAVPGDISQFVTTLNPYTTQIKQFQKQLKTKPFAQTNWRTCDEPIYRLQMDGKAAVILHDMMGTKLRYPSTTKILGTYKTKGGIHKALNTTVTKGWRKILMVVDSVGGDGISSTDFHFFSQYKLPVSELYNVHIETMLGNGGSVNNNNNIYIAANVNAFARERDILQRHVPNSDAHTTKRIYEELLRPGARALTNLRIHLDRIPKYALLFIPRPFWLMNVDRVVANAKTKLDQSKSALLATMMDERNADGIRVVNQAYSQCIDILNKKKGRELRLDHVLGNYGEKAGWASQAMNADGSGKLILDPVLCDRNHGGYDYDKPCVVVKVLDGYGMTSVPRELVN